MKTINLCGNIEAVIFPKGSDVAVCDGFVGNVVLKFAEGLVTGLSQLVKDTLWQVVFLPKLVLCFVKPASKKDGKTLRSIRRGGAPP